MHAVLEVDLQPVLAVGLDELVDAGRAVALLGAGLGRFRRDRRQTLPALPSVNAKEPPGSKLNCVPGLK